MRTLSSSKTRQAKVITPIAVIGAGVVAAAWVMRTEWKTNPVYASCFTLGIALFNFAYLWWSGYWRLADKVGELPQGLSVRRGQHDLTIPFRQIARVGHRSLHSRSVCILELHKAGEIGSRIEFLPISDEQSVEVLGSDLWEYLEKLVSNAQPRLAV